MRVPVIALGLAASVALGSGAAVAQNTMMQNAMDERVSEMLASAPGPNCAPQSFKIYFEKDSAQLTSPAKTTLDLIGGQMNGCSIRAVSIGADGDDVATAEGRKLTGKRGAAVLGALNERGMEPQTIVIAQGDKKEPASASPDHLEIAIAPAPQDVPAPRREVVARNEI